MSPTPRYELRRWTYAPLDREYTPVGKPVRYRTLGEALKAYAAARATDGAWPDLFDLKTGEYIK